MKLFEIKDIKENTEMGFTMGKGRLKTILGTIFTRDRGSVVSDTGTELSIMNKADSREISC